MKKTVSILLCALLIIGLVSGCSGMENEKKKTIVGSDGLFSVQVPESWDDATGNLNSVASVEVANVRRECYFIAIGDYKESFSDFDSFVSIMSQQIVDLYDLDDLGEKQTATVDGNEAVWYSFDVNYNGTVVTMWWYGVQTQNYYAQLVTWTMKEDAEKYGPTLQSVAESFHEEQ